MLNQPLNWKRVFIDYEDGIHNITIDQYRSFYRMLRIQMTFNGVDQIIMIKRSGYYCFLTKGSKGYRLLNGGKKQNIDYGPEYIYDNLQKYADNVNGFFEEYNNNIKQISDFVKSIGGSGRIHGCIVDIDYFNHIYYNPFDGKITTYFAYSIKEKYLYRNLRSLLYYKCPRLLVNYDLTTTSEKINSLIDSKDLIISEMTEFVTDTEIYKISGIFKSFQYLTNHRIIRKWNERMISDFYSAIDIKDDINLLMEGM